MIYFRLPVAMYAEDQAKEVGKALNREKDVEDLLKCRVLLDSKSGMTVGYSSDGDGAGGGDGILFGHEAVAWLAEQAGLDIKPVDAVDIPRDVFDECTDRQWLGICLLESRLERQCDRYRRLAELGAPLIIMLNEQRTMTERFDDLAFNPSKIRWNKDKTILRSLNDVGYSLSEGGWQGWKRKEIDERMRRIEEEEDEDGED